MLSMFLKNYSEIFWEKKNPECFETPVGNETALLQSF
jgi:hypothetical protein